MSEFLELIAAPTKKESKPYHEYFEPENYKKPEIGKPLIVRMFDITDEEPKEVIEVVTGFAARCMYEGKETLAIQLDEESVTESNQGIYRSRYPARVQAVQPGVHTVLI